MRPINRPFIAAPKICLEFLLQSAGRLFYRAARSDFINTPATEHSLIEVRPRIELIERNPLVVGVSLLNAAGTENEDLLEVREADAIGAVADGMSGLSSREFQCFAHEVTRGIAGEWQAATFPFKTQAAVSSSRLRTLDQCVTVLSRHGTEID